MFTSGLLYKKSGPDQRTTFPSLGGKNCYEFFRVETCHLVDDDNGSPFCIEAIY